MRGMNRLLAGAALGLLVMGGTGGQAVAGSITVAIPFVDPNTDASDPTQFDFTTGAVPITPIFGLALWRVSAAVQVLRGAYAVEGTLSGGSCTDCFVSFDINGQDLLWLVSGSVDPEDDIRVPPTGDSEFLVDCGPTTGPGCFALSVTIGATGPGFFGLAPGSFTVQAVSILEAIPEPVGLSLFGVGLIALGRVVRRA